MKRVIKIPIDTQFIFYQFIYQKTGIQTFSSIKSHKSFRYATKAASNVIRWK